MPKMIADRQTSHTSKQQRQHENLGPAPVFFPQKSIASSVTASFDDLKAPVFQCILS